MKIGYIVPEFPSQTHIFFWREIAALRAMGEEVFLCSTRRPAADACKHDFAKPAAAETHYVYPPRLLPALATLLTRPFAVLRSVCYLAGLWETPWRRRLKYLGLLLSAADLVEHARRRDIEHLHAHSCADAAHMVVLCHILGGPSYSLTLHGDLPIYGTDHAKKMAGAKVVCCVTSPLQKQVMTEAHVQSERAPVICMGVETDRFRDAGARSYKAGTLHLVTVARLQLNKGHRFALAAVRAARDRGLEVRYTIVGSGPDRQAIEDEVCRLDLAEHVEFTGSLPETAIVALLQRADAFILPSVGQGEAAPVSVMEAMASGLPVICSRIGGTPDMIRDGVDGILTPQADVAAITGALRLLTENVEERRRLGRAARERAVAAFDSRQTSRRLLEVIRGNNIAGAVPKPG